MLRRHCLAAAVFAFGLAPGPALGATTYVVKGAGNGHGVGMSQYGAYGYAKHGRSYREILAHYYRGTELGTSEEERVRVLLQAGRLSRASFTNATRVGDVRLTPRRTYEVRPSDGGVEVHGAGGRSVARFSGPVRARSAGGIRLLGKAINDRSDGTYRGQIEFRPGPSEGISVINIIGVEDYLRGVIPNESPSSWPAEALKAQAVAARSYAIARQIPGKAFDQYPDQRSQVYGGKDSEAAGTDAAVRATDHEVLLYRGSVAKTFFFSASGGRTEDVENSFYGEPVPYLKSVRDPYDKSAPLHRWKLKFSQREMESRLADHFRGRLTGIAVLERGESPRIVNVKVCGSRSSSVVSGATLRTELDLYDTWAHIRARASEPAAARPVCTPDLPAPFGNIVPPLDSLLRQAGSAPAPASDASGAASVADRPQNSLIGACQYGVLGCRASAQVASRIRSTELARLTQYAVGHAAFRDRADSGYSSHAGDPRP